MLKNILHIGITVKNLEKSINFYQSILGLKLTSRLEMSGKESDILFNLQNSQVKIAYLECQNNINGPSIELLEFNTIEENNNKKVYTSGISEICFYVDDIEKIYQELTDQNVVFLSKPQSFDLNGSKSKAVYFKDPDGTILELIQSL